MGLAKPPLSTYLIKGVLWFSNSFIDTKIPLYISLFLRPIQRQVEILIRWMVFLLWPLVRLHRIFVLLAFVEPRQCNTIYCTGNRNHSWKKNFIVARLKETKTCYDRDHPAILISSCVLSGLECYIIKEWLFYINHFSLIIFYHSVW